MGSSEKWEFKYEPETIDEMILHPDVRERLEAALEDIPNIMLIGPHGTGKGTWVNILKKKTDFAMRKLNGSDERGIDVFREKIKPFCTVPPLEGRYNLMYVNECDFLTPETQAALRDFIESVQNTTRFVFCANYGDKVTPELKSRFRVVEMSPPPGKEIFNHLEYILKEEGVRYKKETLVQLIKTCYPDIRQTIISLQENVKKGVLPANIVITTMNDVYQEILEAMLTGDPEAVRKRLRSSPIDYTALYKYIYEQIMDSNDDDVFANDVGAILMVGEHSHRDIVSSIKEVNFMHMYIKMLNDGVVE